MDTQAVDVNAPNGVSTAGSLPGDGHALLLADAAALRPPRYFAFKGWIEWCLALLLLVPGLPLLALLIAIVRLSSRGPAIYRQQRVGQDGRIFTMYKIRSMVIDAEAKTGPVWSASNDPRVTRLGKWLRKLHLDELPQLFNVLQGHMSLMGPRPERPEIADQLATYIPGYGRRLAVKPGITGLAQINLPPDVTLHCVRRKLVLDLEYIREAGLLLDLRMLFCSVLRMVGISGERATRWMGLGRVPEVPEAWMQAPRFEIPATAAPLPISGVRRSAEPAAVADAPAMKELQPALPASP
jgi:lipopolysaccharide/colanic/teichoic acid biosynthesis glycosyltransferase